MFSFRRFRGADKHPPAPFVVGVSRSGTTLLRLMLDAHPDMAIPPETHFIPKLVKEMKKSDDPTEAAWRTITTHRRWPDFNLDPDAFRARVESLREPDPGAVLRAFYSMYAEREEKARWGDKSPPYVRKMRRISSVLPEARFIHLIRDGRDVALSLLEVEWGPTSVEEAAEKWVEWIARARRQSRQIDHYLEVRFEDLVVEPEDSLRRVCEFIELDFDPVMNTYHERATSRMTEVTREFQIGGGPKLSASDRAVQHQFVSEPPRADRISRWRAEMTAEDQLAFNAIAGELLTELGYPAV